MARHTSWPSTPHYHLWPAWDALQIPVLALRGAHSGLLLPEVAEAMRRR